MILVKVWFWSFCFSERAKIKPAAPCGQMVSLFWNVLKISFGDGRVPLDWQRGNRTAQ
jgi:hypothetical protein